MQKFTLFNMDDLNSKNLMTIFNNLNQNLFEDHTSEPFEYLLAKHFCQEFLKAKVLFQRVSQVFEVNTTLDQIFAIIKSLQLFEWSEISSEKQIVDIFLYTINNGLGDCFLANKMEGLFTDFAENDEENSESSGSEEENEGLSEKNLMNHANNVVTQGSIDLKFAFLNNRNFEETDESLQSPVNKPRLTLSKKIASSLYRKSLQHDQSSSSGQEDSEEQADLVGELPNKYGGNSPKSQRFDKDYKNENFDKNVDKIYDKNADNGDIMTSSRQNTRQTIYDQTNTSFKITLQKSQSMTVIKHRKSSILNYERILLDRNETDDVKAFIPIQEFCAFGVSDLFKSMIENSTKKKKKRERIIGVIHKRNQLMVFDYNMLDVKNDGELVGFFLIFCDF